jgi:hypothetical protein
MCQIDIKYVLNRFNIDLNYVLNKLKSCEILFK